MQSYVNIEVISALEDAVTYFTEQIDIQMLALNVLIHVCGLVACVITDGAAPDLLPCIVNCLEHLLLYYCIELWVTHWIDIKSQLQQECFWWVANAWLQVKV